MQPTDTAITDAIKRQLGDMTVQLLGMQIALANMTARAEAAEAKVAELTKEKE